MSDYLFKMRVVDKDPTGYYYVRWDRATPVEVIAPDRAEAFQRLWALMGQAPRHRTWTAQVDSIGPAPVNEAGIREQIAGDLKALLDNTESDDIVLECIRIVERRA